MKQPKQNKRITFIISSTFPNYTGGRETWLANVANRMSESYKVNIISMRGDLRTQSKFSLSSGINLVQIPTLASIPFLGKKILRSYVRVFNHLLFSINIFLYMLFSQSQREGYFVAMGTVYDSLPLLLLKLFFGDLSIVISVRGKQAADLSGGYPLLKSFFFKLERTSLTSADEVWVNGQDTAQYCEKKGYKWDRILKNGVDFSKFAKAESELEKPSFVKKNLTNITMVASLRKLRDIDVALKAAKFLGEELEKYLFHFVGKGDTRKWRDYAEQLGVLDQVVFPGERRDIPNIFAHSDIVLTFCQEEFCSGLSLSLLEAMASGKAIIAYDNSVYRQILEDERDALLVPEASPKTISEAIKCLVENPKKRNSLGSSARERAREYDWNNVVAEVQSYLEKVSQQEH